MDALLMPCLLLWAAVPGAAQALAPTSEPDTASAQQHWKVLSGGSPVRVEALPDGATCLAFDADFGRAMDRACWDWTGQMDLSQAGRISLDLSTTTPGLDGTVGVYFGTPNGWYAAIFGGLTEAWLTRTFVCSRFAIEGAPDGWDRVTTFRFSVWASGPGKATFRLRNLKALPVDRAENYLRNGSFEAPGPLPLAWGSGHWGIGHLPWAADMDLWRRHFHLDADTAKDGHLSLCLENTPELPLLSAQSAWFELPKNGPPFVLSAWLRSDQERLPVVMQCGPPSVEAQVGREWTQAVLKGVPPAERAHVVIAPKAPGKLWIDAVQVQALEEATAEFHPSYADEGLMAREARADWSPPRRTPEVARGRSTTGAVKPARVEIDPNGRFLLDGAPYLQHSLGLEFISDLDMLNVVARAGFRDVTVEVNAGVTTERLRAIFDRCAEVGLRVIPWLDGNIPRERFTQHITALKSHPALLVWYVYDEPSGEGFAEAEARYRLTKELDPTHPALINYLNGDLEDQVGDIFSTDVYPIPHGTPSGAIGAVATMKAAAERTHRPVWMWLQGTGYAYWMDREPTPRELSCMVYGSLIEGARGIYYFAQVPRTKECFAEMRALCVELDVVAPALGSLEQAAELTCDRPAVLCRAYRHQGETWVLAVNILAVPCRARLTLAEASDAAEVMFENRRVAVADGAWEDDFGTYERHVYRLRP